MNAVECIECARPVGDRLPLCTECGENIVKQLLDVPRMITELEVTRAGLGRVTAPAPVGRSTDTPIPVRAIGRHGVAIQGDRELATLTAVITDWATTMTDTAGAVPYGARGLVQLAQNLRLGPEHRDPVAPAIRRHPETGKFLGRVPALHATLIQAPATRIEQAAVWLAHRGTDLRATEPAADPADRLHVRLNDAITAIGRIIDRPTPRRYLGACPAELTDTGKVCGYELRADVDDTGRIADFVECRRCRTQHDVAQIQDKARDTAEQQLYTIPDLVRVTRAIGAPIPERTLYHWANKARRLTPRGWQHADDRYGIRITDHQIDPRDRQVYRLGDALDLARQSTRKKGSAA